MRPSEQSGVVPIRPTNLQRVIPREFKSHRMDRRIDLRGIEQSLAGEFAHADGAGAGTTQFPEGNGVLLAVGPFELEPAGLLVGGDGGGSGGQRRGLGLLRIVN